MLHHLSASCCCLLRARYSVAMGELAGSMGLYLRDLIRIRTASVMTSTNTAMTMKIKGWIPFPMVTAVISLEAFYEAGLSTRLSSVS